MTCDTCPAHFCCADAPPVCSVVGADYSQTFAGQTFESGSILAAVPSINVREVAGIASTDEPHAPQSQRFESSDGRSSIAFERQSEMGMGATIYLEATIFGHSGIGQSIRDAFRLAIANPLGCQPWSHLSDKVAVPLIGRRRDAGWVYGVGIAEAATARSIAEIETAYADCLAWSPTADLLLSVGEERIAVLDEHGTERATAVPDLTRFGYAAWTPDGRFICCEVGEDGSRRMAFFEADSLTLDSEFPLDPLTAVPLDVPQLQELGGGDGYIYWDRAGSTSRADSAARDVGGCWVGRHVLPNSSELLLSVYRPRTDEQGRYTLTFGRGDPYPICHLDEVWVRVTISS